MTDDERARFEKVEKDVAALRNALVRALALVQRRGSFVPDWRGALRILEHWAFERAPMTHPAPPPK